MYSLLPPGTGTRPETRRRLFAFVGLAVMALSPLVLPGFWIQVGLFSMAAATGALGLGFLFGRAGMVSLGHAAFVAAGAYTYVVLASPPGSVSGLAGLGLPPVVAAIGGVAMASLLGASFSPVASRVSGIYLALVTLGLVFLMQHFLLNVIPVTGGINGRSVPNFSVAGIYPVESGRVSLLRMTVTNQHILWLILLTATAGAYAFFNNLKRSRPGRAMAAMREGPLSASLLGVDVGRYRLGAFVVSAAYAGMAGVMYALVYGQLVPESFGLALSIEFLVMVVIGGVATARGIVVGATIVAAIPAVLTRYAGFLPFLSDPGQGTLTSGVFARIVFAAVLVGALLVQRHEGWR